MGTIGLSFGSPTSGTGFDVSSTVAAIVSNLQNVEKPWKTQLTALQNQDTAISSLGTLLSNLSNDLSQLTDFEGVLAQKTGSSSDTNVLELTSASSSATAGTHSVVVNSLAQTSSGYLPSVASASTTLSGSITIQVGSDKAQTITLGTSNNTLSGLAAAINSAAVGVTANVLTDSSGSRLSLTSSTSGAGGNIVISANSITAAQSNTLGFTGSAGSGTSYSTGTLAAVASASDVLTGSISIEVGTGSAQTINLGASGETLQQLADAINDPTTGVPGVAASVVKNSDGSSSLSLTSQTAGSAGTLAVTSSVVDSSSHLGYASTVTGADAKLTVDGVNLTSASNTVSNLIPGLTFQLLAPSATETGGTLESVQVVIGNNTSAVESTINTMVSDYNSLISAVNTQEGNDSSGNPEPLFGSPTLSMLQQQLLGALNTQNPSGYLDAIASNTDTTLAGSITIQAGNGAVQTFIVGSGTNNPATGTYYTGSGSDYNTLSGLVNAINAADGQTTLSYAGTAGSSTTVSSGTLTAAGNAALSGSMTIQVGDGTVENVVIGAAPSSPAADTIYTGSTTGTSTLSDVAAAINAATGLGFTANATTSGGVTTLTLTSGTSGSDGTLTVASKMTAPGIGVAASVVNNGTQSSLSLLSQTAGASGALSVSSSLVATSDEVLNYTGSAGSATQASTGVLDSIANATDVLAGSITIQVGSGNAKSVTLDSSDNTLSGLKDAINNAGIGVTASIVTNSDGSSSLSLLSQTPGSAGTLTVKSNILDTASTSSTSLNYTSSSDVSTLASLGITISAADNGTLSFDVASLDSVLNSDFSGVLGFFQNANSWGQTVTTLLDNAGSSSPTGALTLASNSNSSMESTLNANISKEELLISAQQTSLTAELNSANEILQMLPSQLQGVNELYSAITGYNQGANG
jgi:flagellar hook-associated protein 2